MISESCHHCVITIEMTQELRYNSSTDEYSLARHKLTCLKLDMRSCPTCGDDKVPMADSKSKSRKRLETTRIRGDVAHLCQEKTRIFLLRAVRADVDVKKATHFVGFSSGLLCGVLYIPMGILGITEELSYLGTQLSHAITCYHMLSL